MGTTGPTPSEVEALREQPTSNRANCRDELCRLLFIFTVTLSLFFVIGVMTGWLHASQCQVAKGLEWVHTAETDLLVTFDTQGQAKVLRAIRRPGQEVMTRLQQEIHAVSCE